MKLYVVKDPAGNLIEMQPQMSEEGAYLEASQIEIAGMSGAQLRASKSLGASCHRASGRSIHFGRELVAELAPLLGYKAVEVEVREKP